MNLGCEITRNLLFVPSLAGLGFGLLHVVVVKKIKEQRKG